MLKRGVLNDQPFYGSDGKSWPLLHENVANEKGGLPLRCRRCVHCMHAVRVQECSRCAPLEGIHSHTDVLDVFGAPHNADRPATECSRTWHWPHVPLVRYFNRKTRSSRIITRANSP